MKGKEHLLFSFLILIVVLFGFFFYDLSKDFSILSNLSINIKLIVFSIFLFLIGSILPDSDSNNKGSLIYVLIPVAMQNSKRNKYKKKKEDFEDIGVILLFIFGILAYPMGWITNQFEKLIMKYTKRERGHRESLHTIFGILIISLFWSIVFYFLYAYFTSSYSILNSPLGFTPQLCCDKFNSLNNKVIQ
jgi:membrane-bound metal-dependent hydrolase YbcI (DUF457 family)